jgi:hypothetical protein
MANCNWPLGNGNTLEFTIYDRNEGWNSVGGLYIFSFMAKNGRWTALYIGQTNDFSIRLPSHERLNEAVQRGATHIHALTVPQQKNRDAWESLLIQHIQPPMNEQLR